MEFILQKGKPRTTPLRGIMEGEYFTDLGGNLCTLIFVGHEHYVINLTGGSSHPVGVMGSPYNDSTEVTKLTGQIKVVIE